MHFIVCLTVLFFYFVFNLQLIFYQRYEGNVARYIYGLNYSCDIPCMCIVHLET